MDVIAIMLTIILGCLVLIACIGTYYGAMLISKSAKLAIKEIEDELKE